MVTFEISTEKICKTKKNATKFQYKPKKDTKKNRNGVNIKVH